MEKSEQQGTGEGGAIVRARVIRADGSPSEVHYSKPQLGMLDIRGRLWARRRLREMKKEDAAWLQSKSE